MPVVNAGLAGSKASCDFIDPLPCTVGKNYDGIHLNKAGRQEWVARLAAAS